ncbi:cyanophycinase [Flavobacterium psychrophilum]|uniref:Cyanophycinase n=5 Tax=Flavobacterium psychrophilum TaxID=96345 RepID=A6GYM5_FLAPJ|nr:cyanophycinase [Flavobacterium psychrophilum]AIG29913.1 cyanophycinase [Flavobacterium psychrophilum]AIG32190.1 cyanophycinase [Flavobacterium psychrophilum]AIG34346.1 cyanophycinase [Flavobacterium psychrophilum]AIG36709.1 cyanophycinase [Flavobacterium psychrophilum]AIG38973.1 cyanophycinase [Flavobacterium psychrophilum]
MNIQGKLVIIGGAVDKGSFTETNLDDNSSNNLNFFEEGILKRIIDESKHKTESRIEVITTASKIPKEIGPEYVKALNYLGANNVDILNIERREEAMDPVIVARLKAADVVMFTGGDQLRLTSILGGTLFHDLLLEKYHKEDFIYAGTSAGAAAASNNMIYQGSSSEALLKGEVKITSGLGLIDGVIIDTHFVQRGRIGRLFQSVVGNPKVFGIGLGEDTGLLITNGKQMEAIGSGLVILVDGREIKDTNLTEIELGQPISISHLVTHVMSKFDTFNLGTFKMTIQSSQYV